MSRKISISAVLTFFAFASMQAQDATRLTIYFANASSDISTEYQAKIDAAIKSLDPGQVVKIEIVGFCDDKGDTGYNRTLAQRRAMSVKTSIQSLSSGKNISIRTVAKGELPLQASSDKDEEMQRQNNRRADIIISYDKPKQKTMEDKLEVGDRILLADILFEGGRTNFLPEASPALESLLQSLQKNKDLQIAILGHVCCAPKGQDGEDHATGLMNLSVVRAKAVYDYLVQNGIPAKRLTYKGMKSDFPTGNGEKADRRVEIEIKQLK
ncbi:MAG: OmpA family protein [Saprospiraceae bacterium]